MIGRRSLAEEWQLQQRFVKAYQFWQHRAPERLRRLEVRMIGSKKSYTGGVDRMIFSTKSTLECSRICSVACCFFSR